MANPDPLLALLPPEPNPAQFTFLLQGLQALADYTYALTQIPAVPLDDLTDAAFAMQDQIKQLDGEAKVLLQALYEMTRYINQLKRQRDQALAERDEAAIHLQDAYLRGLLTREEERIGGEWGTFGIDQHFSLDWLRGVFLTLGEIDTAARIGWVEQGLQEVARLAEEFRQRRQDDK